MINQFAINLNKGENIAERDARWLKRREMSIMTALIIGVLVVSMMNFQQYQTIEGQIKQKEKLIQDIDRQLDSLKKTGKNISKEDVLALAKLEKERVLWTKKLLGLENELPEEMAISYMEYKNQVLLLRFIASVKTGEKEFDKVKEIIDRLRASPLFFRDFSEMRLKEQHQSDIDGQSILSFSVLCSIEKGKRKSKRSRRYRSRAARG